MPYLGGSLIAESLRAKRDFRAPMRQRSNCDAGSAARSVRRPSGEPVSLGRAGRVFGAASRNAIETGLAGAPKPLLIRVGPRRAERSTDQRMFDEPAERALDQRCGSVGKIEPRLRHEEETRLVGTIGGRLGKVEAGSSEASVFVYLTHGVMVPNSRASSK